MAREAWAQAQDAQYHVSVAVGDHPDDVLGRTAVFSDHAEITVDVFKVTQKHDRLEPVLGHEIFHVRDARRKYGIEEFCAIVAREKDLPWGERTVEKSAKAQEDLLRKELLSTGKYTGMAPTRDLQNSRY
jgi:hypothetical protein